MPFRSQAQMQAAFAGGLGKRMQEAAPRWAAETPEVKGLPARVPKVRGLGPEAMRAVLLKGLKG